MAYAGLAWEVLSDDPTVIQRVDARVRAEVAGVGPEAMTGRFVIFDSNGVDLDDLLERLDRAAGPPDDLPLRWVLCNMRERTYSSGWVTPQYSEQRGHDISGSNNYPQVRGRK